MPDGLVVVVDDRYKPRFPARRFTTFEQAERLLDDTPVTELWLRSDPVPAHGTDTLVDILVNESPWSGRSQIERIIIFHENTDTARQDAAVLAGRLTPHYPVRQQVITPELFEEDAPAA
jgi:hypothetical protein